jgi:hypothetical protein
MVTAPGKRGRRGGWVMADLVMAMGILVVAMMPLAVSFVREQKLCRIYYFRGLAMELVDGEMEVLLAGYHKNFPEGVHPYPIKRTAAANLPPGDFILTVQPKHLRLEWLPRKRGSGGKVSREADL